MNDETTDESQGPGGGQEPKPAGTPEAEATRESRASGRGAESDSARAGDSTGEPEPAIRLEVEAAEEGGTNLVGKFPSLSRIASVLMIFAGILVVGLLFYKVMVGFFIPLFMAAALVVIFRPVNEWILAKLQGRRSLAAIATTSAILAIVLVPVILLISIAIGQLTGVVSRTDLDDLKGALQRGRERLGLQLPHADQFRRLDQLSAMLGQFDQPERTLSQIQEARDLIAYLQTDVAGDVSTEESAARAIAQLDKLEALVKQLRASRGPDASSDRIALEERFHRQSVIASAAIASWMNAKLGGPFKTQAKLLTNPSEKDLAEAIRAAREYLQPRFVKLSGVTGRAVIQILIGLLIMVISIYFFFVDGPGMVRTLMRLSPLDDAYEKRLLGEFERTSRAVVLASVLSALAQGALAAIAFFLCGFESYVLLFMATTVMALIPFLGAASVWVPSALYLAAVDQRYLAAILLAVYGAAVVSSIDNLIKAYVLHGHSELHPLVALLSVLGGVPVFGPIGILIGPMVVVFLQTLLEILNHELQVRDAEPPAPASEPPPSVPA